MSVMRRLWSCPNFNQYLQKTAPAQSPPPNGTADQSNSSQTDAGDPTQNQGDPSQTNTSDPTQNQGDPSQSDAGDPAQSQGDPSQTDAGDPTQNQGDPSQNDAGDPTQNQSDSSQTDTGDPTQSQSDPSQSDAGDPTQNQGDPSQSDTGDPSQYQAAPSQTDTGDPTQNQGDPSQTDAGDPSQNQGDPSQNDAGDPTQNQGDPSQNDTGDPTQSQGDAQDAGTPPADANTQDANQFLNPGAQDPGQCVDPNSQDSNPPADPNAQDPTPPADPNTPGQTPNPNAADPPSPLLVLQSITIDPANPPPITDGGPVQFSATGHYSDGSTKDITGEVAWSSSATDVLAIDDKAQATAQPNITGSATITATDSASGVTGSATATVGSGGDDQLITTVYVYPQGASVNLPPAYEKTGQKQITGEQAGHLAIEAPGILCDIYHAGKAAAGGGHAAADGAVAIGALGYAGAALIEIGIALIMMEEFPEEGPGGCPEICPTCVPSGSVGPDVTGYRCMHKPGHLGQHVCAKEHPWDTDPNAPKTSDPSNPADLDPGSNLTITINPANPTIAANEEKQLTAMAQYYGGEPRDVTAQLDWSSSDINIVRFTEKGLAVGGGYAKATITAKDPVTGATGSTTVTVAPNKVFTP